MKFETIHSLGSRCITSSILKYHGYREFSGFFDFINTQTVNTLIHILQDQFKQILCKSNNVSLKCNQLTYDPETNAPMHNSVRTSNKFYNKDWTNVHTAIFPHHDLNAEKDLNHFIKCSNRFKKLKNFTTLFVYTYNSWENLIDDEHINAIQAALEQYYSMSNFKICFIKLQLSNYCKCEKTKSMTRSDEWTLSVSPDSYTGGLFLKPSENTMFMNIINSYNICNNRITKQEIDNL